MKIGPRTLSSSGSDYRAAVDPLKTRHKIGGVTLDLATVTTTGPATLADGQQIPSGVKYLAFGTVIARITASGKFGPALGSAGDGRQLFTGPSSRGRVFIVDRTWREDLDGDNIGEVFDEGVAWRSHIKLAGTADAEAAIAALTTGLPNVTYHEN